MGLERKRFDDGPELFFVLDDSDESVSVVVVAWDHDGSLHRPDLYDISSAAGPSPIRDRHDPHLAVLRYHLGSLESHIVRRSR
jgi:hypothetical protein